MKNLSRIPSGRRSKWLVLAAWLIVAAALAPLFTSSEEYQDKGPTGSLPRGAESVEVLTAMEEFPGSDAQVLVVAVYTRDGGLTPDDQRKVAADRDVYAGHAAPGTAPSEPLPSEDGAALIVMVPVETDNEGSANQAVVDMREAVQAQVPDGLTVELGGPGAVLTDYERAFLNLDETLMVATSSVIFLLLLLIYRSPFLWFIPLLTVGFAAVLTQAAVYLLARFADLPVTPASSSVLLILVFGVGTDYALLLIARYREELSGTEDRHAAMAVALRRSGRAIATSAGTVIVGLCCLALADLQSARSLGLVGAVGIACALVALVTALPALLVIAGRWVFWPLVPRTTGPPRRPGRIWAKIGNGVARRPRFAWFGSLAALAVLCVGLFGAQLGLAQSEMFQTKPESLEAQEKVAQHYPPGESDPVIVITDSGTEGQVTEVLSGVEGVADVRVNAESTDGDRVRLDVVLTAVPESEAAMDIVGDLRDAVRAVPGADTIVGGTTAITLDIANASVRDLVLVIPVVLAVILLFLIVLLRSLVAPLLMLATLVVSYLAAVGAAAWLFENAFGHEGLAWPLPLVSFVFLAALGVDYSIFLMARVREEAQLHGHVEGVKRGLAHTGGVISSAGIVLAATFAMFTIMPVVDMVQFGVVVGLGVLLDAFLVRTVLLPALLLDAGRIVWWPGALFRTAGRPAGPDAGGRMPASRESGELVS